MKNGLLTKFQEFLMWEFHSLLGLVMERSQNKKKMIEVLSAIDLDKSGLMRSPSKWKNPFYDMEIPIEGVLKEVLIICYFILEKRLSIDQ